MTFNLQAGEQAKADGISAAAHARRRLLAAVKNAVKHIAMQRSDRTATADDFQLWLEQNGHSAADLGNAAGAVFSKADWEFTGLWVKSARETNHAHQNRVWRLK